jgi:pSer/pThr/pTyr-binding forkhead associated (FHA) protein
LCERLRALEGELVAARERATSLESELRAARERIERLETDARASASLLGNLQQNIARLGKEETGARPALKVVGGTDQLPQRFLVSEEGSQRHELARRSTIGRTPENDIQIDANFVSRRHAVILGSPQHCIIEDLESVNGVQVNGRRVTRHFLRDGDVVTIGRTTFRFQESSQ